MPTHSEDTMGANDRPRMRISTRLFLSYIAVLAVGLAVAFAAGEAATPFMMRVHERHQGMGMDMDMDMDMHGHSRRAPGGPAMDEFHAEYGTVTQQSMLIGLAAGLLVAAGLSMWLSKRITAPLRDMHYASERIAEGRYEERLNDSAPGEVGELAAAFNRMAGELEASEARRSSLIGNVAHEFRTPLTSLRGYIEGIADGHFAADPEVMDACHRQLSRLRTLVDDLSLLSRVEAGVEPVEPQSVNPASLLSQARADLSAGFEEKGVILEVDVSSGESGGPPTLYADPNRTLQVIENLMTNALRHTPAGGTVRLSAHHSARSPESASGAVIITVADSGEGIPDHAVDHVFERFYRGETSRARREKDTGTGIGLTVAKAFVEAQGGRIWIESTSPEGTVTQFSLPTL